MNIVVKYLNIIQGSFINIYNYFSVYLSNFMKYMSDTLTNREMASIFLMVVFVILVLSKKEGRRFLKDIIKLLLNLKLMIFNSIIIFYFILTIFILNKLGFWEDAMWKSALIWFIFTAMVFIINAITKKDINYDYFKNLAKKCFKIFILVQFLMNMQSFSFVSEVVILIVLMMTTLMNTYIEIYDKFSTNGSKILYKILSFIQSIIVITILWNSIIVTWINIERIEVVYLLKDIALPSILTLMFIPFTYIAVIFTGYEELFIRVGIKGTINKKIRFYLYLRILLVCGLSIERVKTFTKKSNVMVRYINTTSDVDGVINNYKYGLKNINEVL